MSAPPIGHVTVELREGDDRAGEGNRADGDTNAHFDQIRRMDRVEGADAIGFRRKESRPRNEHSRKADQRVEGGDELGHLRHRNAPRNDGADTATNGEARNDEPPCECVLRLQQGKRGHDGNGHADHAVGIALT